MNNLTPRGFRWVLTAGVLWGLMGMTPQVPKGPTAPDFPRPALAFQSLGHQGPDVDFSRLKGRPLEEIKQELEKIGWFQRRPRLPEGQIPGGPYVGYPKFVGISKPLTEIEPVRRPPRMRSKPAWMERARDLRLDPDLQAGEAENLYVIPHFPIPKERRPQNASTLAQAPAPAFPGPGPAPTPGPMGSFEGLNNYDNQLVQGFQVLPPDVEGDVGRGQYVEFINLALAVYDKNTGAKLAGPLTLSQIFGSAGWTGPCALTDDGDPIVLYDQEFDRWVLSQFQVSVGPPFSQCIAVSMTPNAAGAYFVFEYTMPNNYLNDYPHFAIWSTQNDFGAYFMTDHEFGGPSLGLPPCPDPGFSSVYCGQGVFAFDRLALVSGNPNAAMVYFGSTATPPSGYTLACTASSDCAGGMLAADWDGSLFPPGDSFNVPGIFIMREADEFGAPADRLRLFRFRVCGFAGTVACPTSCASDCNFVAINIIPVAPFDPRNPAGRDDIPQPGVDATRFLDSISDRLMHRVVFRRFSTSDFPDNKSWIVLNHTVCASPNPADCTVAGSYRAGVRWYILEFDNIFQLTTLKDQGTVAPPDGASRWMASVAINQLRDFCVSYTVSSATVFPSIRYACRTLYDPPGTLRDEAELIAGSASQTSTASRWGDYSMLSVDPVDQTTFFPIHEYYTLDNPVGCSLTACWHTRFGKFRFQWDIDGMAPVTFGLPTDTPVPADYNGDGKAEIAVFRSQTAPARWFIRGVGAFNFGTVGDTPVPRDYNGDGKADIAVVRNMGTFLRWFIMGVGTFDFGAPGDIPVPADYDGDGKADIAVVRNVGGTLNWFIRGIGTFAFGAAGDTPVPADYNGDGKADIAVVRNMGTFLRWFIMGVGTFDFGAPGDLPVPADYNGDGKADIAVVRTAPNRTRQWFIWGVGGPFTLGVVTDRPVPADYDGDGKANLAVFRTR